MYVPVKKYVNMSTMPWKPGKKASDPLELEFQAVGSPLVPWELNLGSLVEQYMILTTEPSL